MTEETTIEVQTHQNGELLDRAYAETAEDAIYTARHLIREAASTGRNPNQLRATFVAPSGEVVASDLRIQDLR